MLASDQVHEFLAVGDDGEHIPVAVPIREGLLMKRAQVSIDEGTFLAYSKDPRARAVIAIMLAVETRKSAVPGREKTRS